jgi:hypothetical protein
VASRTIVTGLTNAIVKEHVWTLELLERTPDDWFWRRGDFSDNAIGWHAGHITYCQDEARVRYFATPPVYGAEEKRMFGFGCAPLPVEEFPTPAAMRADFAADHARLLEVLSTLDDDAITRIAPHSDGETIAFRIGGILAHLAEHSGGISTLFDHFESRG